MRGSAGSSSRLLSEALGERLDLTLIDKNDCFFFGFSKLDVMFGRKTPDAVRIAYRNIVEARRALSPGRRSPRSTRWPARHDRRGDLRGRCAGRGAGRGLRPGRHAGAGRRRQRVLLLCRRRAACARCSRLLEGPRHRRRNSHAVQVPAGAERSRPVAARSPHRAAACGTPARSAW